jgi:hypothetical protein
VLSGLSPAGGVKTMSQLSQMVFDSKSWEDDEISSLLTVFSCINDIWPVIDSYTQRGP